MQIAGDDKTQLRDNCDKKQWQAATTTPTIQTFVYNKKAKAAAGHIFIMYKYFAFFFVISSLV